MARTSVATDDFSGTLSNWTQINDYWGPAGITSGKLLGYSGGTNTNRWSTVMRSAESFNADQYAQAVIGGMDFQTSSYGYAVMVRCSGDVNTSDAQMDYYAAVVPSSANPGSARNCRLVKCVNGTTYTLGDEVSIAFNDLDVIGIEVEDTTIRFFKGATEQFSRTDLDLSTGKPGLLITPGGMTFDNFEAGNLTSGSTQAPRSMHYFNMLRRG